MSNQIDCKQPLDVSLHFYELSQFVQDHLGQLWDPKDNLYQSGRETTLKLCH